MYRCKMVMMLEYYKFISCTYKYVRIRIIFVCSVLNYFEAVEFYVGVSKKCLCSNTTEERVSESLANQESDRKKNISKKLLSSIFSNL